MGVSIEAPIGLNEHLLSANGSFPTFDNDLLIKQYPTDKTLPQPGQPSMNERKIHKPAGNPEVNITQDRAGSGLPYRRCAGIMLINRDGLVWVGRRIPKWAQDRSAYIWQMPQGGIDKGEDPGMAAQRELKEETGVTNARFLRQSKDWLFYDLPDDLIGFALKGKYRGQKQKWFAYAFTGEDDEIDISGHDGEKAEFDAWRWEHPDRLADLIVPFKRDIYRAVVSEFRDLLAK